VENHRFVMLLQAPQALAPRPEARDEPRKGKERLKGRREAPR
jgi:hypothetical protein